MDTRAAADRFARTWEDAWRRHDVDTVATLYAEDCVHRSMPFRPVHAGRAAVVDYVRWAFSTEDTTEVAQYSTRARSPSTIGRPKRTSVVSSVEKAHRT